MYTKYFISVMDVECPEHMNKENCPLQDWLKNQNLFRVNGVILYPNWPLCSSAHKPYYRDAIEHMNQLCRDCQNKIR